MNGSSSGPWETSTTAYWKPQSSSPGEGSPTAPDFGSQPASALQPSPWQCPILPYSPRAPLPQIPTQSESTSTSHRARRQHPTAHPTPAIPSSNFPLKPGLKRPKRRGIPLHRPVYPGGWRGPNFAPHPRAASTGLEPTVRPGIDRFRQWHTGHFPHCQRSDYFHAV